MIWIKFLSKLIKVLNKGASPRQISGALAMGAIIGLTPSFLIGICVFFLVLLVNVNISMAILSMAVFKLLAYAADPLAHELGYFLLVKAEPLKPLWTALYNAPFVPFTKFNNTVVMGSFAIGLLLFLPLFFLGAKFVTVYRSHLMQKVQNYKLVRILKTSKIYKFYENIRDFRS